MPSFRAVACVIVICIASPRFALSQGKPKVAEQVQKHRAMLNTGNPTERIAAVLGLKKIGPPAKAAVPDLITILGSKDLRGAGAVMETIIAIGGEGVSSLSTFLSSKNARERSAAAYALGEIGEPATPAVPFLREQLGKEEDQFVELSIIASFGKIGAGAKAAVPDLIKLIGHKELSVRGAAVGSIKGIGKPARAAGEKLVAIAGKTTEDSDLRVDSYSALVAIGTPQKTLNRLAAQLLVEDNLELQLGVLEVVRTFGKQAEPLLKGLRTLRDMIKEDDPSRDAQKLRAALIKTIETIDPPKKPDPAS